jgi:hypothetical protein
LATTADSTVSTPAKAYRVARPASEKWRFLMRQEELHDATEAVREAI